MNKGKRSHTVPGEDAGVGNGSNSSDCCTPVYHPQRHLWGEQSAGKHRLVQMRNEEQACLKEAGINPGLEQNQLLFGGGNAHCSCISTLSQWSEVSSWSHTL